MIRKEPYRPEPKKIPVPRIMAPMAPLRVNACFLYAMYEMLILAIRPIKSLIKYCKSSPH